MTQKPPDLSKDLFGDDGPGQAMYDGIGQPVKASDDSDSDNSGSGGSSDSEISPGALTLLGDLSQGNDGNERDPEVLKMLEERRLIAVALRMDKIAHKIELLASQGKISPDLLEKLSQVDFTLPQDQLNAELRRTIGPDPGGLGDWLISEIKIVDAEITQGKDDVRKGKLAKIPTDEPDDKKPGKKKSPILVAIEKLGLLHENPEKNPQQFTVAPQIGPEHDFMQSAAHTPQEQPLDYAAAGLAVAMQAMHLETAAKSSELFDNALKIEQSKAPDAPQPVIQSTVMIAAQEQEPAATKRASALSVLLDGFQLPKNIVPEDSSSMLKPADSPTILTENVLRDRKTEAPMRKPPTETC